MARQNPPRDIGGESNLAERIRRELKARKWSPADLATRLTEAGCPIATSAIYKIVSHDPPRKITVDELLALVRVFETTLDDLLTDVDLLDKSRAQELLRQLDVAEDGIRDGMGAALDVYIELLRLSVSDRELYDYVMNRLFHPRPTRPSAEEGPPTPLFTVALDDGTPVDAPDDIMRTALDKFAEALIEQAKAIDGAIRAAERGRENG